MVVLTTGKTTTSGVLAVLANTTVTGRDVAAVLASLGEPRRHFLSCAKEEEGSQRLVLPYVIQMPRDRSTAESDQNTIKIASVGELATRRMRRGQSCGEEGRRLTLREAGVEGVYGGGLAERYGSLARWLRVCLCLDFA